MRIQRPTALLACAAIATALPTTTETAGAAGQADRARCDHAPHADHLFDVGCLAPNGGAARADFNGDGKADLAIGVPGEDHGATDSGLVHVAYGSATGLRTEGAQIWEKFTAGVIGAPGTFERLGSALAAGDFTGDGRADLAIGVPGSADGAGEVHILLGSPTGLTATGTQRWTQGATGLETGEADDSFGHSLATGDFNRDGKADLAIGAPDEDRFGTDAGAVSVLYGTAAGLVSLGAQVWGQGEPGVAGAAQSGDRFGSALMAADYDGDGFGDLAVGVPGEGSASGPGAGVINILYGAASGLSADGNAAWGQASLEIATAETGDAFGATLAAGDFNRDGRADLAIGAPGENTFDLTLDPAFDSGQVYVMNGTATGLTPDGARAFGQEDASLAGAATDGERFGSALAARDFNGNGVTDLAVGVPFDDPNGEIDSGAVNVIYGQSGGGLTVQGDQYITQDVVLRVGEPRDHFGAALTWGDYNGDGRADLAVGVPGEDFTNGRAEQGLVNIVDGRDGGLTTGATAGVLTQDLLGEDAESGDGFGSALY